jgi:hypothetical protein
MTTIETVLIGTAFALVVVLCVVLYPRPRLQLSERGFLDRDLRLGWIGWDEIEGAYPPSVQDGEGLRLRVRPGARLLRRLRRRHQTASKDGAYELRLDLSDTDISPVELLQEVLSRTGSHEPHGDDEPGREATAGNF